MSDAFRTIRSRLIIVFIILSSLPLLIVGAVSFYKSFQSIEKISVDSYTQIAEQLNKSIELLFGDGEKFLSVTSSEESFNFLKQEEKGEELYSAAYDFIQHLKEYRRILHFDDYIKGVYIIGFNGFCISEKRGLYSLSRNPDEYSIINRITAARGETVIVPNRIVDYASDHHLDDVISFGRIIQKPVTHDLLGVVIVDIELETFQALCEDISIGNAGEFYVIAENMQVLYPPKAKAPFGIVSESHKFEIKNTISGSFLESAGKTEYFLVYNTLEKTGWKIVGLVERRDLMSSAYEIKRVTIILLVLSVSLSILIYYFVSEILTRPIRKLQIVMKEAEGGNFNVRAYSSSRDEIADLCGSFNAMIRKIRELMQITIEEHEELKKYELKALQAQVNPHFLYNSLDAIIWMAEAGNKDEVVHITKRLSSFFRLSLSKGREWISLRDEITHVGNYLEIQKMRYRDILTYNIDVPEELLSITVLKIILQPIVENALYHGIKNKRVGGKITLTGRCENGVLIITVSDNGAGIDSGRLDEINTSLIDRTKNIESRSGIGLKNIHQRLKLYYGNKAGLEITSKEGHGTEVKIILPALEGVC